MIPHDDRLAAYADGELSEAERRLVDVAAKEDADLAERLAAHQALRSKLSTAYDPVLEEPLPAGLTAAVMAPTTSHRFGQWPAFAAMAACLVVGLVVGRTTLPSGLIGDDMRARGQLVAALDSGLASEPEGPVRIGVSFESAEGYCRSFRTADAAGLACREDRGWSVEALAPFEASSGAYQTASSMPPALAAAIEARMAGEPLDAAGERAARDRGWTP